MATDTNKLTLPAVPTKVTGITSTIALKKTHAFTLD
jgi:hypothetical protein